MNLKTEIINIIVSVEIKYEDKERARENIINGIELAPHTLVGHSVIFGHYECKIIGVAKPK